MICDTAGVVAQFLQSDVYAAACVCKLWNEWFQPRPLEFRKNGADVTMVCGELKFGLCRTNSPVMYYVSTVRNLFISYPFYGIMMSVVVVDSANQLASMIKALGPRLQDAVVVQYIPLECCTWDMWWFEGHFNMEAAALGWKVSRNRWGLVATFGRRRYQLYSTAALAWLRASDVGIIRHGYAWWCASIDTIIAVRQISTQPHVYIHVMAAVYFCRKKTAPLATPLMPRHRRRLYCTRA